MIKTYYVSCIFCNGEQSEYQYNTYAKALKDFNLFVYSVRPESCTLWEEDRDGVRVVKEYRKEIKKYAR